MNGDIEICNFSYSSNDEYDDVGLHDETPIVKASLIETLHQCFQQLLDHLVHRS